MNLFRYGLHIFDLLFKHFSVILIVIFKFAFQSTNGLKLIKILNLLRLLSIKLTMFGYSKFFSQ